MIKRTPWAIALIAIVGAMAALGRADHETQQAQHLRYCEDVALWQAEAARGIDPHHRTGHPDYQGIAEEHCPGLRPAR